MTRSLLIANPAAARTARVSIDLVANTLRKGGWEVEVLATTGPGHDALERSRQRLRVGL